MGLGISELLAAGGTIIGVAGAISAATTRRKLKTAIRASHTDKLTGLLNRAGMLNMWPAIAKTRPNIAIIDLDKFKPINDTYGHVAGDIVLQAVAGRLSWCVPNAHATRLGGDEFVVFLPERTYTASLEADRIAKYVRQPISLGQGIEVMVSVSIGISNCLDGDLSAALHRADYAMYEMKNGQTADTKHAPEFKDEDITSASDDTETGLIGFAGRPPERLRDQH